jgi:predicted nucleotidyltransferase
MNELRDDLPENIKRFFKKIQNYLDTKLYFYGSVTRADYVPGKSDIDVAIFTDNEHSTISKLQHVLHVKRDAFEKIVWKLNGTMMYGYKIKCEKYTHINSEISIYNNDFKTVILDELTKPLQNQSWLVFILLYLLKLFYYKIPLLSKDSYMRYKRKILNEIIAKKESVFFVMKPNNH